MVSFTKRCYLLKKNTVKQPNLFLRQSQTYKLYLLENTHRNISTNIEKYPEGNAVHQLSNEPQRIDTSDSFSDLHSKQFNSKEVADSVNGLSSSVKHDGSGTSNDFNYISSSPGYIPEPPVPQSELDDCGVFSTVLGLEPSLASQGIGGLWPPYGILQEMVNWIHISVGLPWWGSIAIATVITRILTFYVFVKAQRNAAVLRNNMPQIQAIQEKLNLASRSGNRLEMAMYTDKLTAFMKEKGCNPLKNMLPLLYQAPLFLGFYLSLKGMVNLPVQSFQYGGMLWFTDLTIPDPYYILPIITSATLYVTLKLGMESGANPDQAKLIGIITKVMPVVALTFTIHFSSAILCYWVTNNGITLLQASLVKIPQVREFLKIPKLINHPTNANTQKKGFKDSMKETYNNFRILRELEGRSRAEERFQKEGKEEDPKTPKFDPPKEKPE